MGLSTKLEAVDRRVHDQVRDEHAPARKGTPIAIGAAIPAACSTHSRAARGAQFGGKDEDGEE